MEDGKQEAGNAARAQGLMGAVTSVTNALVSRARAIQTFLRSDEFLLFAQQMLKFGEFVQKNGKTFREGLEQLPTWLEGGVSALAHHGWFVGPDVPMSLMLEALKLDDQDVRSGVEAAMVAHFEEQLDTIEKRLIAFSPERERLIHAAFFAVRRGEDDLAVPMLFIQADGFCEDHRLGPFFMRARNESEVPAAMKRIMDGGYKKTFMFAPVFKVLPLYMRPDERGSSFIGLNRHQVLHGVSLDYGTHANSLRAVSFLNVIACLLMDWKRQAQTQVLPPSGEEQENGSHHA